MPNPQLSPEQREEADRVLGSIRGWIDDLSGGDPDLRFAYRRRIWKQLEYDERSKPALRKRLKKKIWERQGRCCAECDRPIPLKDSELDRLYAPAGYTEDNVRVLCRECHRGL